MIEVSDALAAAIEARQRTVLLRTRVDWDGDGYGTTTVVDGLTVDIDDLSRNNGSASIQRALTTELPAAVRFVDGYAAAEATVALTRGDVTGEDRHAAWYFTRGNSDSPIGDKERLRREATVDIGFETEDGPQYVRRLTGLTRRLPTFSRRREAELSILDYREKLRAPVTLVPTLGDDSGCDGTWIVTQALAANGIGAGPLPRAAGSLLWAPMYGSLNPIRDDRDPAWWALFLGPDVNTRIRPRFRTGPWVLANDPWYTSATDYAKVSIQTAPADLTWTGYSGRVEMWVVGAAPPTSGAAGSLGRTYLRLGHSTTLNDQVHGVRHNGQLFFDLYDLAGALLRTYSSTFTVPGDGAWHFVGIHFDHTAQRITFRLDNTTETLTTAVALSEIATPSDWVQVNSWQPMSDLHIHDVAATSSWLHESVTIGAYIDPSALQLVACYEDRTREAWDLLAELAAAEQAVSQYDEAGLYRYRTRRRLVEATAQTVQRALTTADASLLDIDIDDGIDQVRNIIQAPYTPVTDTGLAGFVYTDTERRVLAAGTTLDLALSFSDPVLQLQPSMFLLSIAGYELGPGDPYIVATSNSDFSADGDAILVYYSQIYGDVLEWQPKAAVVRLTNFSPITAYITAIGLYGRKVTVGNAITEEKRNQDSIDRYGPQPLLLPTNQWVQSASAARGLARRVLGELKNPHPTLTGLRVVGDPRLQLSDRVTIADPAGTTIDGEYWLTAAADDVSDSGGYTQQVTARAATTVMRWGSGRWGVNTWGQET